MAGPFTFCCLWSRSHLPSPVATDTQGESCHITRNAQETAWSSLSLNMLLTLGVDSGLLWGAIAFVCIDRPPSPTPHGNSDPLMRSSIGAQMKEPHTTFLFLGLSFQGTRVVNHPSSLNPGFLGTTPSAMSEAYVVIVWINHEAHMGRGSVECNISIQRAGFFPSFKLQAIVPAVWFRMMTGDLLQSVSLSIQTEAWLWSPIAGGLLFAYWKAPVLIGNVPGLSREILLNYKAASFCFINL